jgi:hypothetical protein
MDELFDAVKDIPQISVDIQNALNNSAGGPNEYNPFATMGDLPASLDVQLGPGTLNGLLSANNPNEANAFVTFQDLPEIPEDLDGNIKAALQNATNPGQDNAFATM